EGGAGGGGELGGEREGVGGGVGDGLAERCRHAGGGGARRDPPWLQHQDLAVVRPSFVGEHQRHAGGLAGARRRHQDGGLAFAQRGRQRGERLVDRQREFEGIH